MTQQQLRSDLPVSAAATPTLPTRAPFSEPAEREDPRNALLDSATRQIVDLIESAVRNDVLVPLLARIESQVPALSRVLAPVLPPSIPAPAKASCGSPAPQQPAAPGRGIDTPAAELRLTKLLAALRVGNPKTPAARDLVDGARMDVLSELAALRAARSVIEARGEPQAPRHSEPVTYILDDAGSGQ